VRLLRIHHTRSEVDRELARQQLPSPCSSASRQGGRSPPTPERLKYTSQVMSDAAVMCNVHLPIYTSILQPFFTPCIIIGTMSSYTHITLDAAIYILPNSVFWDRTLDVNCCTTLIMLIPTKTSIKMLEHLRIS